MMGLAEKTVSPTRRGVGRDSVEKQGGKTQPVPVRIGPALRARIDASRGDQSVAEFIRDAVVMRLDEGR